MLNKILLGKYEFKKDNSRLTVIEKNKENPLELSWDNVDTPKELVSALNYFADEGLIIQLTAIDMTALFKTFTGYHIGGGLNRGKHIIGYMDWHDHVITRDGRCQKCGKSIRLEAHHYCSFSKYPTLATNYRNGITFCTDCHKEFHDMFPVFGPHDVLWFIDPKPEGIT